jgi:iron complex transport system substrate-binding protein
MIRLMMFRKTLLPILLILHLTLAACASATSSPAPTDAPPTIAPTLAPTEIPTVVPTKELTADPTAIPSVAITLTDSLGREVTLAKPATHIVSLAPSNTETLYVLGALDTLVGRDDYSDFPAEVASVPSIGNLYPNVNAEAVIALKPDLVLAAGVTSPDDVKKLADLGLTVYATSYATSLDDIYADIQAVGTLIGKSEKANAVVDDLKARVAKVAATAATAAAQPSVFYEVDATEPEKPWTAGSGTFIDNLITLAGGQNAAAISADYYQINFEQLLTVNPEVIVLGSSTYGGQTPELVAQRPGWDKINAVKNNAVYIFDDNLVSRPGPRIVEGLEALAKLIHPELFK